MNLQLLEIAITLGLLFLRFAWFSLASLEHFSSAFAMGSTDGVGGFDNGREIAGEQQLQQLQQQQLLPLSRDDSNESGESSVGDLPIELRHLEGQQ